MCYLWVDAAKDRDNYKRYYEYFQEMDKQKAESSILRFLFIMFLIVWLYCMKTSYFPVINNT